MEKESEKGPENKTAESNLPVNYEQKVEEQEQIVKKAAEAHAKHSSADSALELDRETDLLRHYANAKKENPKERAQAVAELAKRIMLNRAVQQMPAE